ncbi:hypothetical protein PR048_022295 [Dryococelus australis]|uniref:Uncharacterized protein n=1 Tax=Dryococelus australis TaxID=614101 RepID=A0ABQ9H0U5_9NEOP|nr:hypothetical protein PR048_022295 [Dryococelus australis]
MVSRGPQIAERQEKCRHASRTKRVIDRRGRPTTHDFVTLQHGCQSNTPCSWAVSVLASHQGKPSSIPGRVTPGFSHVGIVPEEAVGRRVYSGISRFPYPSFRPQSPSSSLKISLLRAVHIPALTHPAVEARLFQYATASAQSRQDSSNFWTGVLFQRLDALDDGGREREREKEKESEILTEVDLPTVCWTLPPIGVQGLNLLTNRKARYSFRLLVECHGVGEYDDDLGNDPVPLVQGKLHDLRASDLLRFRRGRNTCAALSVYIILLTGFLSGTQRGIQNKNLASFSVCCRTASREFAAGGGKWRGGRTRCPRWADGAGTYASSRRRDVELALAEPLGSSSQTYLPLVTSLAARSSIARNSATHSLINSNSTPGPEASRDICTVRPDHLEGLMHPESR